MCGSQSAETLTLFFFASPSQNWREIFKYWRTSFEPFKKARRGTELFWLELRATSTTMTQSRTRGGMWRESSAPESTWNVLQQIWILSGNSSRKWSTSTPTQPKRTPFYSKLLFHNLGRLSPYQKCSFTLSLQSIPFKKKVKPNAEFHGDKLLSHRRDWK